jgi:hypothetical protein
MLFFEGWSITEVLGTCVTVLLGFVGVDCLGALYAAYKRACMRLDNERWLRDNCRDPTFYSNMRAHTDVCSEVETNARIGAFWTALREVTDVAKVTWQPYVVGFALAIVALLPVCWVCAARATARCAPRRREWGECIPIHSDFKPVRCR